MLKDGASDTTGVSDTKGGAKRDEETAVSELGRSAMEERAEKLGWVFWSVFAEGRLCSYVPPPCCWLFGAGRDAEDTADKGAARLFFMREKREVTRVYEDCSSSSENGLKEVRLARESSGSLEELLREGPLDDMEGEKRGDSIEEVSDQTTTDHKDDTVHVGPR